jgi:hypothetical protein
LLMMMRIENSMNFFDIVKSRSNKKNCKIPWWFWLTPFYWWHRVKLKGTVVKIVLKAHYLQPLSSHIIMDKNNANLKVGNSLINFIMNSEVF